jgi:hypothetical protein
MTTILEIQIDVDLEAESLTILRICVTGRCDEYSTCQTRGSQLSKLAVSYIESQLINTLRSCQQDYVIARQPVTYLQTVIIHHAQTNRQIC